MPGPKAETVERLKTAIAALEKRPPLAVVPALSAVDPGFGPLELLAAPGGLLHEVFLAERRHCGAGLGFSLGLAQRLLTPVRQAVLYLELAAETQEMGFPYAPGLSSLGFDPDRLVLCRIETMTELLWALEESLGCRAVAAVIADVPGHENDLDFTASRRLSLKTAASGASAFLLRYSKEREASAAKLRWRIAPAVSAGQPFDATAPGPPRFAVTLEKSRLGIEAQRLEGQGFELDWVDHGFVIVEPGGKRRAFVPRRPAPSRPQPAELGDRLSEAS